MLSDLGSANGTFLGSERLASGEARPLADGQSFSIGDSVLVVRPCALRRAGTKKLSNIHEIPVRTQGASAPAETSLVAVRVRMLRRTQQRVVELVLGEVLAGPHDFMLWLDDERLVLGVPAPAEAAVRLERDVIRRLGSFSVTANVSARVLSVEQIAAAGDGLFALLSGDAPIALVRGHVLFEDPVMKAVEQTVLRVAKTSVSVLVLGETGAGKDVIAAMLHELSPEADGPYLALNCASLPETLLESELFGYERGAFTGATSAKPGLLEAADGGTVFLDEIGDLPLALQAKLLRVFESHEVTRLGALKPRKVDVRFVAATNRDLARDVSDRTLPSGSLLPAERCQRDRAAPARASPRHRAARSAVSRERSHPLRNRRSPLLVRCAQRDERLSLARQRPRAQKRRRTRRHPHSGPSHRTQRPRPPHLRLRSLRGSALAPERHSSPHRARHDSRSRTRTHRARARRVRRKSEPSGKDARGVAEDARSEDCGARVAETEGRKG